MSTAISETLIEKLGATAWWQYRFADFDLYPLDDVERFVDMIGAGRLSPYRPEPILLSGLLRNWLV